MEMSSVTGRTHLRVINDFIKCTSWRILRQRERERVSRRVCKLGSRGGATSLLQVLQLASRQCDGRAGRHSESRAASKVFLFGKAHICLLTFRF